MNATYIFNTFRGKSAFFARRHNQRSLVVKLEPLSIGGRNTRTVPMLPLLTSTSKENFQKVEENKFMYSTTDTRQKV